jgi:hypothetical protein
METNGVLPGWEELTEGPGPFQDVQDPHKRAFLRAYAVTMHIGKSSQAARISPTLIYTRHWKSDLQFQRYKARAKEMAGAIIEDEAVRRAVQGVARYKHNSRTGEHLRHPIECECGHPKASHVRLPPDPEHPLEPRQHGQCLSSGCDCDVWVGAPYVEHEYSDALLSRLLTANVEGYRDQLDVRALGSLDVGRLPNSVVARLAGGENPLQVLVAALQAGEIGEGHLPAGLLAGKTEVPPKALDGTSEDLRGGEDL